MNEEEPYDLTRIEAELKKEAKSKRQSERRKERLETDPEFRERQKVQYERQKERRKTDTTYRKHQNKVQYEWLKERLETDQEYRKKYIATKRESKNNKKRTKDGKKKYLLRSAKKRTQKNGLVFSIQKEGIDWVDICPVLGIPLDYCSSIRCDNNASLDRFDNSKGYTPGNVRVISLRANQLKRDGTLEEMRQVVAYMEGKL